MLTLWRIAKTRHAGTAFDGEGARLNGGRWNTVGVRVAYASESVALATLEVMVGMQKSSVLSSYSVVSVRVDEAHVESLPAASLPSDWRSYPPTAGSQAIGDRWIAEERSLVLRVPSAIVEAESNYLLNPAHSAFGDVAISAPAPFTFDSRLLAMLGRS